MMPSKLSDCLNAEKEDAELLIVEGDSAAGTAKQARDRNYQAILPLRGKVPNCKTASRSKVMGNQSLRDVVAALGCGIGEEFDVSQLRYDRVILLADADADGLHLTMLMLTFFRRHLPVLVSEGRVYVAAPPLYRIDVGQKRLWAANKQERDRILAKARPSEMSAKPEITRFKGLGGMLPKDLWETTLDPKTRCLMQVNVDDPLESGSN